MTTTISDFTNVREKLASLDYSSPQGLALLPANLETAISQAEVRQLSETGTVRTLFRRAGIPLEDVFSEDRRPPYIQNNDISWIAPTIFVAAGALSENPNLVSIAYGVLTNYLTDFFKGKQGVDTIVQASIVVETTAKRTYKKINYEGPISGLADMAALARSIQDDNRA